MDNSTCKPVQQFLSKYSKANLVGIVKLCNNIVSIKYETKTNNMDTENKLLCMSLKDLKNLAQKNKINNIY